MKGNRDAKLPKAYVFETGTNVWRQYDAWPPKNTEAKMLYLNDTGRLTFTPPTATGAVYDEYVSDPAKPVPFIGYTALGVPQEYMCTVDIAVPERTNSCVLLAVDSLLCALD